MYALGAVTLACVLAAVGLPEVQAQEKKPDITSDQYYDWIVKNAYLGALGVMKSAAFLETFVEYPPSQSPASFSVDQIVENVKKQIEQMQQKR
jgi:arylsulfatase